MSTRGSLLRVLGGIAVVSLVTIGCSGADRDSGPGQSDRTAALSDAGAGPEPPEIDVRPASADPFGEWDALTIESVTVEVPSSPDWRVDVVVDPCSTTLARWVLLEHAELGARIKIDMVNKTVDAEYPGAADRLDGMISRIQTSLNGDRVVPGQVERFAPFPTSSACDPRETGVPTLRPLPDETPGPVITIPLGATATPVTPPAPDPR